MSFSGNQKLKEEGYPNHFIKNSTPSCACVVEEYVRFETRQPFYKFLVALLCKKFLPTTRLVNLLFCKKEDCLETLEQLETILLSIRVFAKSHSDR